ncbi:Zn-ribbon domain-containing OB-fold protein [Gordonia shandongensis]|uniref:Zn-ribbon domain-containing OB-fold protein n=1 Tax=Gordonia shandongensis TaxID=376351 RepID=UPI0003FA5AC8|nr:zinc ribbon domain-containing protein [Gordonia shandongensis]
MTAFTPVPTPGTRPYWEAAARGELWIQRCRSCRRHYFYPRPFCPQCASDDVEWTPTVGRARLVSYAIDHRPLAPVRGPVVVALVELAEGPRMMTNLVDVDPRPDALPLDMALTVRFREQDGLSIPVFGPAGEDGPQ